MHIKPNVVDVGVQCDQPSTAPSSMVDAFAQCDMGTPLFISTPSRDYNSVSESEFSVQTHAPHTTFHKKARII